MPVRPASRSVAEAMARKRPELLTSSPTTSRSGQRGEQAGPAGFDKISFL